MNVTCLARIVHIDGFEEDKNFKLEKINGEFWWVGCPDIPIEDVTVLLNRKVKSKGLNLIWMFKFEDGDL